MLNTSAREARDRTLLLAGLSLSETISWGILYYAFTVFVRPMEAELGWSRTATSTAFSIGMLVSAAAAPFAGWFVDRGRARVLMTAGSGLGGLMLLAWSRVTTLTGLYAVWVGMGVAMAATLYEPAFAVLAKRFGEERRRALAALTVVAGLASTVFVPLAGHLQQRYGWRAALVMLALVVAGVTAPVHAVVLRRPRTHASSSRDGGPLRGAVDPPPRAVLPSMVRHSPTFWRLTAVYAVSGIVTGAVGVHLVPYLVARGESVSASAALAGAMGALQLPGRLLFAPLASRVRAGLLLPPLFALQALGLGIALLVPGRAGAVAFVACFGVGNGLKTLARATVVADVFGTAHYGSIAGALAAFTAVARALGPVAAGWTYDSFGRYEPLLGLLAIALGLSSFAALVPGDSERRGEDAPRPAPTAVDGRNLVAPSRPPAG